MPYQLNGVNGLTTSAPIVGNEPFNLHDEITLPYLFGYKPISAISRDPKLTTFTNSLLVDKLLKRKRFEKRALKTV